MTGPTGRSRRPAHRSVPPRSAARRTAARLATSLVLLAVALSACSSGAHPNAAHPGRTDAGAATGPAEGTTSTASTSPVTTAAPAPKPACTNRSVVDSWTDARKAAQTLAVPVLGAAPGSIAVALSYQAGGMLLLGSVPPASQLASALRPAVETSSLPRPMVMVDQEGGGVQRLGADVTSIPWPRQMASTMTPTQVTQLAETVGRQMASLGVGVDLAPVLDLDGGPQLSASDPDGPRSFSPDPAVAAGYGDAFAAGLRAAGVLAVVKHFPGLGGATGNTDYGPASTRPIAQLQTGGLIPFERSLATGVRAVMVANATVPGLTTGPASVSAAAITDLLRTQLHFDGLVMTDSLSAGALTAAGYDLPSAIVAALRAGADMVLFGSTLTPADTAALAPGPLAAQTKALIDAVTKAVASGALPESRLDDAALHVVQAKGLDLCTGSHT